MDTTTEFAQFNAIRNTPILEKADTVVETIAAVLLVAMLTSPIWISIYAIASGSTLPF